MQHQVKNKLENLSALRFNSRVQGRHAFAILHREKFRDFGVDVAADVSEVWGFENLVDQGKVGDAESFQHRDIARFNR